MQMELADLDRAASPTGQRAPHAQGDCAALEKSPIAVDSFSVRRQQAAAGQQREPILFQQVQSQVRGQANSAAFQMYNTGDYVRIMAPPSEGHPLGAIMLDGAPRGIVFADLHVPGEHVFDGQAAAAEVQLVHLPKGGGPAIAAAVRFAEATDSGGENPWLQRLVDALPRLHGGAVALAPGSTADLHPALARGSVGEYFHYNGTLTRSPCRPAEWFLLEEVGRISTRQLAALRKALPLAPAVTASGPFAAASLITEGVRRPAAMAPPEAPVVASMRRPVFAAGIQRHIRV